MSYYCSTAACMNKAQVRGLCRRHYEEAREIERDVELHMSKRREQQTAQKDYDGRKHTVLTAYLLAILGGLLALHKFYLGNPVQALLFILTIGGLGIWWLIDLITLPRQVHAWNQRLADEVCARHRFSPGDLQR